MKRLSAAQLRLHDAALRLFAQTGRSQISISDLADAAGVARGTVYNNLEHPEALFEQVAGRLAAEMHRRVLVSFGELDDPAQRLAHGARSFVRRAHEEPHWGRFLCRFGLSAPALQTLWRGPPMQDLLAGVAASRYHLRPEQTEVALGVVGGAVLSACYQVLEGHRAWRDAGSGVAELLLRALGLGPAEARRLSIGKLPPLLPAPKAARR